MRLVKVMAGALLLLGLAACSSVPGGAPGGGASAGRSAPGLDYLRDDLSGLLVALDLPPELEPARLAQSVLDFTVIGPGGERRIVSARLVQSDAAELAALLPPPADSRSYYLFGLSGADRTALKELQGWAATLPSGTARASVSFKPELCRTDPVDPAKVALSVLLATPARGAVAPLLRNEPLSAALAASGRAGLPTCPGHSG